MDIYIIISSEVTNTSIRVHVPTRMSDCRVEENIIYWSNFRSLDKVDFFKQAINMICDEVVKATKNERRMKEALNNAGDLLKVEKWTTRANQVEDKVQNHHHQVQRSNPPSFYSTTSFLYARGEILSSSSERNLGIRGNLRSKMGLLRKIIK